ncbi:hypothetical protein ACERIM_09150 [Natrinema sp. H-ect1]|uniref:hypothetical protein n=1 Tax=Natrinema sp. H-ect1 TaxID=3242700 RepID=UPI00359CE63D
MTDTEIMEDFVASAVRKVYTERGLMVDSIDVSIDVDQGDELSNLHDLDDLTFNQARQMLEAGELTPEEFLELAEDTAPGSGMGGMPGWTKVDRESEESPDEEA